MIFSSYFIFFVHETKEGKIQEKSRKNLGNMHCDFFAATGAAAAFNALKTKAQQKADAAIRLPSPPEAYAT